VKFAFIKPKKFKAYPRATNLDRVQSQNRRKPTDDVGRMRAAMLLTDDKAPAVFDRSGDVPPGDSIISGLW
jgi:hypothetical protein